MSEVRHDPGIGLAMPQERMAPRSRQNDLLAVTIALSVLLITAILAVSLTLRMLTPKSALAIGAGGGYADPLVLNGPPRILLLAHTTPAPPAMPILRIVPVPDLAGAPTPKGEAKRQARQVALTRADLYLPPLLHGTPDTSAPSEDWTAHGSFHSKANCEKFRRDAIDDTITGREADPDREIYDVRIRLLMAGRCEDESQDQ